MTWLAVMEEQSPLTTWWPMSVDCSQRASTPGSKHISPGSTLLWKVLLYKICGWDKEKPWTSKPTHHSPGDLWCPESFHFDPGNVPGRGFKHRNNQELDQCAKFCSKTPKCCSFEHSFEHRSGFCILADIDIFIPRMCNLNKECKPTKGQFQDFVFCVKKGKGISWKSNFVNLVENLTSVESEINGLD